MGREVNISLIFARFTYLLISRLFASSLARRIVPIPTFAAPRTTLSVLFFDSWSLWQARMETGFYCFNCTVPLLSPVGLFQLAVRCVLWVLFLFVLLFPVWSNLLSIYSSSVRSASFCPLSEPRFLSRPPSASLPSFGSMNTF